MASLVKINNRLPAFSHKLTNALDNAMSETARDILIKSRNRAPFRKGALRANSITKRMGSLHHRVSYWMEYARFQEFGGDTKRRVRNYSAGGTGKHYLKNAGDDQAKKLIGNVKKHGRMLKG